MKTTKSGGVRVVEAKLTGGRFELDKDGFLRMIDGRIAISLQDAEDLDRWATLTEAS